MSQVVSETVAASSSGCFEAQIRARVESLSYLPTTAAVAMKFIELGKNLDADPSDYAKVISADSSLSSKILAMANSSWAGVRHKVTNVKTAVNLLGLGTVRTLAISYCLTGLHNELQLSTEESNMFWEASLCKAAAAKVYASRLDTKQSDEAFVAGLFQDFAMTVMYSIAREAVLEILRDSGTDATDQLQKERGLFRMDHAEVGRMLAQRMQLPDLYVDAIAFHHDYEKLAEFIEKESFADVTYVASLFPHVLNAWHRKDAESLCTFLIERDPDIEPKGYLEEVQKEFEQLFGFFHQGGSPNTNLAELLEQITREAADNTTQLVSTVNELVGNAAKTTVEVSAPVKRHDEMDDRGVRDPLTGVLTRAGFVTEGKEALTKAARYAIGFAVVYLDIDRFKKVNDQHGHEFGDLALTTAVGKIIEELPQAHLIGRMGGDEFVVLLNDCTETDAAQVVDRIIAGVAAKAIRKRDQSARVSLSAGLFYVRPSNRQQNLDALVNGADKLMNTAKRAGGNQSATRILRS